MSSRVPVLAAVTLALACTLPAQTTGAVRALPQPLTGAFARWNLYVDPLDMPATVQTWVRGDAVPAGLKVSELGLRQASANPSGPITATLELVLDRTSLGFGNLSATPAKNLSTNATKLFSGQLSWPTVGKSSDPDLPSLWIKLTQPWVQLPGNLIVQFTLSSPNTAAQRLYADGLDMAGTRHVHYSSGRSCGATLGAGYDGSNYVWTVTGAPANAAMAWLLGADKTSLAGIPLPLPLDGLGLKGCELGVAPLATIGAVTDASGSLTVKAPFTLPADTMALSTQVVHVDGKGGLQTTNVMTSLLGDAGLLNMVYAGRFYALGPFKTNYGPVLLAR
ncbi:MAG: hypothetical protein R3F30_14925 [Planctomycetota bacterium]